MMSVHRAGGGPTYSAAVTKQRSEWDLPAWRLAGHPVVFAVICFGFAAALISLGLTFRQDPSTLQILWRLLCVVATGYATFYGLHAFRARRRERRSTR